MNALMILLEAYNPSTDVQAQLTTMLTYVGAVVPAGLLIWGAIYGIGLAKKAAKKATSG